MSASGNILFVSYSHEDQVWLDRLLPCLDQLRRLGVVDAWSDRRIKAGDKWFAEIKAGLQKARAAILLISKDFLASDFCMKEEVPFLLEQAEVNGLLLVPVLIRPCAWKLERWLSSRQDGRQMMTREGKSVAETCDNEIKWDAFFAELVEFVAEELTKPPPPPPPPPAIPVDIARLPTSGRELFGRKDELAYLDEAWDSATTTVVSLVAWGGVGKSALVNRWLEDLRKQGWRGAERVFGWSFYSQGSHENAATSADDFIDTALRWFGDPKPAEGSAWDKGERLAALVRRQKTLLVLDGLEPLQWAEGYVGQVKDPALATLIESLAESNPGLVLITTRQHVAGLEDYEGATDRKLDWLSPAAGRALLRTRGVPGDDAALEAMSKAFENHALAVSLLARFLTQPGSPGLAAIPAQPRHDCKPEERAPRRVLDAFADTLGEGPERQVLRLLGLFDRPAGAEEIQALRAAPAIPDLTDRLEAPGAWAGALDRLRTLGLIAQEPKADSPAAGGLDAHPLVRSHFADDSPEPAAQAGHDRLYRHLIAKPAKDQPDTLADLRPLYLAIPHGVAAGHAQEVFDEVFQRRINRRGQAYGVKKLGAHSATLAALAAFFDPPWLGPLPVLRGETRSFLLNAAGYCLRALGRLAEVVEPYRAALKMSTQGKNWTGAAIQASNLSELLVTLGRLPEAVAAARQAVELADRSGDVDQQFSKRTIFADALHQSGAVAEAERGFVEAETMQREWQPACPLLTSLAGFRYCDLLLSQGLAGEVRRRAAQTLVVAEGNRWLLDIALDQLSLGRVEAAAGEAWTAASFLERAVNSLHHAGAQEFLALGLLARAAFWREQGQFGAAGRDLAEVRRIAMRGGMRLFLIDADLEAARLCRDEGREIAPGALEGIRAAIADTGYHRRDGELAELVAWAGGAG